MKKMILSLVAIMMCATATYAQTNLLATLSHNGEITTFYGANALRDAHETAEAGDVITLSSGTFNSIDITKGITIRGAGMRINETTQTEPTVISGDVNINIPTEEEYRLTLEGLYFNNDIHNRCNLNNPLFLKSCFKDLNDMMGYGAMTNATFIHCRINSVTIRGFASFVNCVLWGLSNSNTNVELINSIIHSGSSEGWRYYSNLSLKNCILFADRCSSYYAGDIDNCIAYNCISIVNNMPYRGTFSNVSNSSNIEIEGNGSEIFATFTGSYNDDETFELTEEAQTQYLGIDGTQVGIYGGSLPYDPTPTNPQITKCNVAAKSTADGKLSVDIEVNAAE